MNIQRLDVGPRMSQAVIHGDTIYLAGQVGHGETIKDETQDALAAVDKMLAAAGSDKSHVLSIVVWLSNMDYFEEMNAVYDAWIDPKNPPARAAGEARLATPDFHVEFIVIAAKA